LNGAAEEETEKPGDTWAFCPPKREKKELGRTNGQQARPGAGKEGSFGFSSLLHRDEKPRNGGEG